MMQGCVKDPTPLIIHPTDYELHISRVVHRPLPKFWHEHLPTYISRTAPVTDVLMVYVLRYSKSEGVLQLLLYHWYPQSISLK